MAPAARFANPIAGVCRFVFAMPWSFTAHLQWLRLVAPRRQSTTNLAQSVALSRFEWIDGRAVLG
jgi:hypothetical protein